MSFPNASNLLKNIYISVGFEGSYRIGSHYLYSRKSYLRFFPPARIIKHTCYINIYLPY